MDIYGGEEDTKKPWTEQETLLLLEVRITSFISGRGGLQGVF